MRNRQSVFTFPYRARHYITHPHKFVKQCYLNLKMAWMRATKGYCDWDAWDFDEWFLDVIPNLLRKISRGHGYPGIEPFETPEKWRDWLITIAERLENCTEEKSDRRNQYYEDYIQDICTHKNDYAPNFNTIIPHEKLTKMYFAREKQIGEENQQSIEYCFAELAKHFYKLWD